MKLTPIDIKKQTFNKALRGYDPVEVDAFLETVAKQWEELLDDYDHAKRRLAELEGEIKKHKELEGILHQTLAQAQHSTAAVVENAKREAELIRQEAQLKASQIIDRAKADVIALGDDVQRLNMQKHEVVSKLRLLLSSQLDLLNSFSANEDAYIVTQIAARKKMRSEDATEDQKLSEVKTPPSAVPDAVSEPPMADTASTGKPPLPNGAPALMKLDTEKQPSPKSEPLPEKTVRIDVPLDGYKGSSAKRAMNIDDLLDSLE